jgi:hypothetical protein
VNENDVMASLSLNRVLIAVDVATVLNAEVDDKELIVDYNEDASTFTFSVRN